MLSVKSNGIMSNCPGIAPFWIKTTHALNSDIMTINFLAALLWENASIFIASLRFVDFCGKQTFQVTFGRKYDLQVN